MTFCYIESYSDDFRWKSHLIVGQYFTKKYYERRVTKQMALPKNNFNFNANVHRNWRASSPSVLCTLGDIASQFLWMSAWYSPISIIKNDSILSLSFVEDGEFRLVELSEQCILLNLTWFPIKTSGRFFKFLWPFQKN